MLGHLMKMRALLDRRTKRRLVGLFALMLMAAILEMAGVGLVLPLLQIVVDPNRLESMPLLPGLRDALGLSDTAHFVLAFTIGLTLFFAVKNAFLAWLTQRQNAFVQDRLSKFSTTLFDGYLRRSYAFHLHRNSAELIRNVTQSAPLVYTRGLLSLLNIAMELILSLAALAVVFRIEPMGTLFAGLLLGIAGLLFHRLQRDRYHAWGKVTEEATTTILQWLNQGLGGVKEAKVLACEGYFSARLGDALRRKGHFQALSATHIQLPRLFIEVVAIGCLAVIVAVVVARGQALDTLVPTLGVFGIAAFRLMPSLNRVLGHAANLKQGAAAIDLIYADIMAAPPPPASLRVAAPVDWRCIDLEGISFRYEAAARSALDGITLRVYRGESLAFVGTSGAGKTTLADTMLGLVEPQAGRLVIDGQEMPNGLAALSGRVGYVPQAVYLMDDTLKRNIAFGVEDDAIDDERVRRALALAQLDELVDSLPEGLATKVGERGVRLSGGQRQRLGIARALYPDPDILILDEATAALDNETEHAIAAAIAGLRGTKTVILIAHRLSTVRACDRLHLMRDGRIIASGRFEELAASDPEFRRMVELGQLDLGARPEAESR